MELRQLRSLLAVQEAGSFSAAAEALATVQSNVSAHISKLERELQVILVDRRTGTLTAEGEIVAKRARHLLGELAEIYEDLAAHGSDATGRVRVGMIATVASWLLPRLLERLRTRHPRIELEIAEGTAASLQRRLHSGSVDLAVLTAPIRFDELLFSVLLEERYVLVVPADNPLASHEQVTIAEAATLPMLVPPVHVGFRDELEAIANARGARLSIIAEIDGLNVIAALALRGYAPAILPASAVETIARQAATVAIEIVDVPPRQIGLARHRNHLLSAAARAVATELSSLTSHEDLRWLPAGVTTVHSRTLAQREPQALLQT
jgi:DNA-binding transcriptional LysR family regulator